MVVTIYMHTGMLAVVGAALVFVAIKSLVELVV
jgi:hypothetical protein